jgi:hypothetical protein
VFCARCGQQLPDKSETCSYCGQPANWVWQPAPPPPAPGQPAAAAPVRQFAPSPGAVYGPQGVGGALLFFCICFTILWPLWVLSQYARFHFRMNPLSVIGLVRLAFGVLVGIMLWTRQSAAMVLLRIHLAATAAFTAYNLLVALLLMFRYTYVPFAALQVFSSIAVSVIFLLSAIIYFSVSQRVRATYGSKLFG